MNDPLQSIRTRNARTSQREQADDRQVQNNAGGFTFTVSERDRIMRFLTLGVQGGTFYQKEKEYTKENANAVIKFAKENGSELVRLITDVSVSGRAPRQQPALFALATVFAFSDTEAKREATDAFNSIVRTGTHLFTFVAYLEQLRGWGRAVKRAVASWYEEKSARDLSYQMVKYRHRANPVFEGTHRNVLRSAHPVTNDPEKQILFDWACGRQRGVDGRGIYFGWTAPYEAARILEGTDRKSSKAAYAKLIREHPGLPWEALPDVALTFPETWEALLDAGVPMGALIRQLPRLTKLGLLQGPRLTAVTAQLTSQDSLRKARVHPVKVLYALKTYAQGHGFQGKSTWTPVQAVVDALDAAFYASFKTVEPAGKRTLVALDVSGSMTWPTSMCGVLQAREASAAMAMVTLASEPGSEIVAFSCGSQATQYASRSTFYGTGIEPVALSPRRRLDDNIRTISQLRAGGTDCALPMIWAREKDRQFDTFVIYTDNETRAGDVHPHQALRDYRQVTGINAKLIVAGMSATHFTIADPSDSGMLDVAGFDADTPAIISGFSRGDFS